MRPFLVIRPEPGNLVTVERARTAGFEAIGYPLFEVTPLDWVAPQSSDFDAILFTSANAIRHSGAALQSFRALPAFCIGQTTAQVAAESGFTVVAIGESGVSAIPPEIKDRKTLHLGGRHLAPDSVMVSLLTHIPTYENRRLPISSDFQEALGHSPIIAVHSSRAAAYLVELISHKASVAVVAFSEQVANSLGTGWEAVAIATKPRDEELIAAALALKIDLDKTKT